LGEDTLPPTFPALTLQGDVLSWLQWPELRSVV